MLTPKQTRALNLSIAHWKRLASGETNRGETHFAEDCACCEKFQKLATKGSYGCDGCPIMAVTGNDSCYGTPWYKADEASKLGYDSTAFKDSAAKMLAFLRDVKKKLK